LAPVLGARAIKCEQLQPLDFIEDKMDKKAVKLNMLRQVEDLVQSNLDKVGPVMDDYDGGQKAAYENVLNDLRAFKAIVNHVHSSQQYPGMDY
jgi:hypothetical protein